MKRYKKTKRSRSRGGNNELYGNYNNPKPIINYDKDYGLMYNKPNPIRNYDKDYGLMYNKPNPIINNDKFKYYSSPSNDINDINDNIITKKYDDTNYKELYEKP
jgi:hypothetical protein